VPILCSRFARLVSSDPALASLDFRTVGPQPGEQIRQLIESDGLRRIQAEGLGDIGGHVGARGHGTALPRLNSR
jgi:hypothetical protein